MAKSNLPSRRRNAADQGAKSPEILAVPSDAPGRGNGWWRRPRGCSEAGSGVALPTVLASPWAARGGGEAARGGHKGAMDAPAEVELLTPLHHRLRLCNGNINIQ